MKKNIPLIILYVLLLTIHNTTFSSTIQFNNVNANTEECFTLDFTLKNTNDITTAIITFSFDSGKMQIGCNEKFNPEASEIYTFETNTASLPSELPIILPDAITQQNFKCKLTIYPEGVYTVAIWGGNTPIPSGTIFSVPAKLLSSAQEGDALLIKLHSVSDPAIVLRSFEGEEYTAPLYCSFSNINAIPIYPNIISGIIYVGPQPEAEIDGEIEGEAEPIEGASNNDTSQSNCGCSNKSSSYSMCVNYMIVIMLILSLSGIKYKDTNGM